MNGGFYNETTPCISVSGLRRDKYLQKGEQQKSLSTSLLTVWLQSFGK